jgi:translation initiation factor 6
LGCEVLKATFSGSGLAGIYVCINKHGAVLPSFCSREEIEPFKSRGLEVYLLPGRFSAAGNNIAANDFGAVANPEIPPDVSRGISDCLGVEVSKMRVAGYLTVGSAVIATNKGFAAHNRASEEELKELQSILRVSGLNCTLNTGVPFVSIGAVANSRAAVVGEASTGFEAGRLSEALSLI